MSADIRPTGERLREERTRLGLSQPAFGEIAGAAKRTVIDWEKGVSSPTVMQLSALMAAGVDALYVLTGVRAELDSNLRPAIDAAEAVAIVVELLDEFDLQGKLAIDQIRILANWIVEQRATKDEARAFVAGGRALSIGQLNSAPTKGGK
ncbi:helix-turn-helix domain-containing protein [Solimonas flava]|uniref:helix-turn-helix domain-containing protein n=1 Tax=Solimonas flava TaxID=415849 RepID=UPI0012B53B4E|nr:helix-turn-helix domain-containing protein [Solimonas flava]